MNENYTNMYTSEDGTVVKILASKFAVVMKLGVNFYLNTCTCTCGHSHCGCNKKKQNEDLQTNTSITSSLFMKLLQHA